MLFDTLRRKNQAEQEEREWNANRPADYVSRNKDAMDSLTGQIGSGFDWDTGSKAYQQYRAQAQANAAASRSSFLWFNVFKMLIQSRPLHPCNACL